MSRLRSWSCASSSRAKSRVELEAEWRRGGLLAVLGNAIGALLFRLQQLWAFHFHHMPSHRHVLAKATAYEIESYIFATTEHLIKVLEILK